MTLKTPAGRPGLVEDLRQREHAQRRLLRGLDDHRAAGGDGRADLARAHRHREVPRRDRVARPDRLLHRDQPPDAVGRGRRSGPRCAPPPPRTSGRTRRRRRSRPWTPRAACPSRASSAAPGRPGARSASRTRAAGSRRARAAGCAAHSSCTAQQASSAALASSGRRVGDAGQRLAGRGILDLERLAARGVAPLAADEQLRAGPDRRRSVPGLLRSCHHRFRSEFL